MARSSLAALFAAVALLVTPALAAAAPEPLPYRAGDECNGQCNDILPPGTDGTANLAELGVFLVSGERPEHSGDQLPLYGNLIYDYEKVNNARIGEFFKDDSFGVKPSDVDRTYSPRDDVTIVRDKSFGVPHVYGSTRDGAMFGLGYIAAEDRLFLMDALRNAGRGQLSSFAGGAKGNRQFDREQWEVAPYSEADLQKQFDQGDDLYGADGTQLQRDAVNYTAGVNEYIDEAKTDPSKMPGEYAAIGQPQGPDGWKTTDIIATAALVGGIFGKGGGTEVENAVTRHLFRKRFGGKRGEKLYRAFRSAEDPEAPTTTDKRFPYRVRPSKPEGRALPDRGFVSKQPLVVAATGSGQEKAKASRAAKASKALREELTAKQVRRARGMLDGGVFGGGPSEVFPKGNSNALLVSKENSETGRPVAVMGPQTGYFSPQLLMEYEVQAPSLSAKGSAFAGTNLYVQLGRGRDYAWSATSAGQDIIDTFAAELCEPDGSEPSINSMHYLFRGKCTPIERLVRKNSWEPTPADDTPAGTETLERQRTNYGLVTHRGRVKGKPVAYTALRATYFHEVDSAIGFSDFNDPGKVRNFNDYKRAANKIGYTFNWFYIDRDDIGYFNSGANVVRAENTDPDFPVMGKREFEWKGFNPSTRLADLAPQAEHPQDLNKPFMSSWNNKQAPSYRAADSQWGYTSTYRSHMLDSRVKTQIMGPDRRRITRAETLWAAEAAGATDLRVERVLRYAERVINQGGRVSDPKQRDALEKLRNWRKDSGQRIDRDRDGTFDSTEAIKIMDAWWPKWVEGQFTPVLGDNLFDDVVGHLSIHDGTDQGSAFQSGWYGYVRKDLRTLLGSRVKGKYPRTFCGRGSLGKCRDMLLRTLGEAVDTPYSEIYNGEDATCDRGDRQWCFDAVRQSATGGISQDPIHWINRPTYHMVLEFPERR
ncbi:MAG: penicillin acylase family protein [Solirubrobacterales bacterium]